MAFFYNRYIYVPLKHIYELQLKREVFPSILVVNDLIAILFRDEIQLNIHFLKQNRNDLRVFFAHGY